MRRVTALLAHDAGDQLRLLAAAVLLVAVRVAIYSFSYARVRRLLLRTSDVLEHVVSRAPAASRIAWAVDVADTNLPGHRTCLVRSTSAEMLLRVHGYEPDHRIGVDRADSGTIEAHSWLELDGDVLIGLLPDLSRFEPLPALDPEGLL